jgi:hypothetical protein
LPHDSRDSCRDAGAARRCRGIARAGAGDDDHSIRWNGFVADVTERVGIEQQLRQAEKMEAIGTLTSGLAHDFDNLLGVVIANLGLACARPVDGAETSELVDDALDAALRGGELT